MTKQQHEMYDLGYIHGLEGHTVHFPYSPKYMEGWYEGHEELLTEMRELDLRGE